VVSGGRILTLAPRSKETFAATDLFGAFFDTTMPSVSARRRTMSRSHGCACLMAVLWWPMPSISRSAAPRLSMMAMIQVSLVQEGEATGLPI
jgi:hypothetical protein